MIRRCVFWTSETRTWKNLKKLKEKVQFEIEQIANEEYVEYTSETLHELFDEIEEEGLKRMEARRDNAESE